MSDFTNLSFKFPYQLKKTPTSGNLVYEYNPFYNYRIQETKIKYNNKLYALSEFWDEFWNGLLPEGQENFKENFLQGKGFEGLELSKYFNYDQSLTLEILFANQLTDFETDELQFDLSNPVNILPQWSYDNSTNLVLNDGKNPPRLINSRFSPTKRNQYEVYDRKGTNDTNIYDEGVQFDIDTSLYKKVNNIPKLAFKGVSYGGNMGIGNYHFYFKYVDEDGNESDFFAESGLVSVFIGNSADSIVTGVRDENSHKQVKFQLTNLDVAYSKILVYYSKATSDIDQNAVTKVCLIEQKYTIDNTGTSNIVITGYENVVEKTTTDINQQYQIYGACETQASAQNMLFLANNTRPKIDYDDFQDCALRFMPDIVTEDYNIDQIGSKYTGSIKNTYWDPDYIYNKVGYWDDEMYRFGIVFILNDNTLTDVFNIRGRRIDAEGELGQSSTIFSKDNFIQNGLRQYIQYDDTTYFVKNNDFGSLDNVRGVVYIPSQETQKVIGIQFKVKKFVIDYLRDTLKVKGWFFVRQKRMPTTLCQAYTIGIDNESHTPVIPISIDATKHKATFVTESFLEQSEDRLLTNDGNHLVSFERDYRVGPYAAICPEYDINSPYLNSLFTGQEFTVYYSEQNLPEVIDEAKYYKVNKYNTPTNKAEKVQIIGVEDNVKLVAIHEDLFSARAGEAEEAFRYAYIERKNKVKECTKLLRGSFGPYLGISGLSNVGQYITIKIPNYSFSNLEDYFKIRFNDKNMYYAISDKYSMSDIEDYFEYYTDVTDALYNTDTLYRGDCYICQFTHRLNRNFQDPSAPTNDDIVDEKCWKENYEIEDNVVKKENFDKINLGDVNAVELGLWITVTVRSSMNLNIRTLDDSIPDEIAMFDHARGFYPYHPMSRSGTYKIPEALVYNKGFQTSVSSRYNVESADVPYIKNEFSNRIAYSNVQVQDAFQNGWRTFMGTHYRDYPKTYGSITKIVELRGSLLCVFEHGVALIPVNERALAGSGSGGNVYINTNNVLPQNPKIISDTFGSQWRDSIIQTPLGIYGVDTIGKKIWRTNGENFELLSDFKIQEFLNKNISLTERELEPVMGIRNVKTHYNKFKHDVMFTFYDNLYGFEEKVWNICYSELIPAWTTFYSWVPSFSENIYNQYFSFDRNTSKWIAKLGISKSGNSFSDGIVLDNNIINCPSNPDCSTDKLLIGKLSIVNRNIKDPTYTLEHDNFGNWKKFEIDNEGNLYYTGDNFTELCTEYYVRKHTWEEDGETKELIINNPSKQTEDWFNYCIKTNMVSGVLDEKKRKTNLDTAFNTSKIVTLLNIKATSGSSTVESVVAVTPKYNLQFLTTNFWKHGQSGIIDTTDTIKPCNWYGKQHPFEFEFVVADNPQLHKIFDNLEIISNSAEPESFHYEIVGDCYEFAPDKKNMYIRQEATKELFQYNGSDILYDTDYSNLKSEQRQVGSSYDKSTLFPLYYDRIETFNEVEDSYNEMTSKDLNYASLAGAEILYYDTLGEYRISNHSKAVDMQKEGRLRGNMHYKEDKWYVQISPINFVQCNEPKWGTLDITGMPAEALANIVPIELGQQPVPNSVIENLKDRDIELPENSKNRALVRWGWSISQNKEAKVKDKWVKIKIRYSGKKLAVITAVKTLYSASYS